MKKKGIEVLSRDPGIQRKQKLLRRCMVLLLIITCLATSGWFFAAPGHVVKAASVPVLTAYDITPRTVYGGSVITFSYTINNPNATAQDIRLGATIRDPSYNYISDPGSDIVVSAIPGTATYTRTFHVADNALEGQYTVYWGIYDGAPGGELYQLAWANDYLNVVVAPTVTLSFDDGYTTIYQNGLPVLNSFGYQATVFQITGLTQWDSQPLMTVAQLQSLKANGWEIASHSVDHPDLTTLTQAQLVSELSDSKDWLVNNGLGPVFAFAYPFGDANGNVYTTASQYYKYGRTIISGINNHGANMALNAAMLWGNTGYNSLNDVEQLVTSAINQNKWAIIVIHGVTTDQNSSKTNSTYGWVTTDVLTSLCQFLQNTGVPVKTFSQIEGVATPVNHAPVAVNDSYGAARNTTLSVAAPGVLGNDTDADGDTLTAAVVTGPSHGALTLNANGSFAYTPATSYTGSDNFTYMANDGKTNSNTATVSITVSAVNHAPVAVNDAYSTNEDTVLSVAASGVLVNDTDADGDSLTAAVVAGPSHGTLILNTNGSFTYTPAANYNGSDSFTYQANDGKVNSNTATVTITIAAVNDAPVAVNDSYTANANTALSIPVPGVLGNDSDVDGDTLTAAVVAGPSHGTLTLNANGSFTYTPATNYTGSDSFTYRANDGKTVSNTATVSITVVALNSGSTVTLTFDDGYTTIYQNGLPVLNSFGYQATVFQITGLTQWDSQPLMTVAQLQSLKANGWEIASHSVDHPDLTTLTQAQLVSELSDSKDWLVNNGLGPVFAFAYPFGDANGNVYTTASQYYKYGRTIISGINSYGTNMNLNAAMLWGNTGYNSLSSVEQVVTSAISQNKWAIIVIHGVTTDQNSSKTNSTYGWVTTDVLTSLCQFLKNNGVPVKTFSQIEGVTTPVNHAPVAVNDSYSATRNTTLSVAAPGVLGNDTDADGDSLTAAVVSGPSHGTLTLNANGSFTYTPATSYTGSDSFTYQANDGKTNSNTATVSITVSAVNHAPVAVNDAYSTNEDTVLSVAASGVLVNDTDSDGDSLTAAVVAGPSHGTLILNTNGSFTYTPAANYNGSDSFTYQANDGKVNSNTATVTITIAAVNDAPVAVNDAYSMTQGAVLTVAAPGVLVNDTDVDGDALTATRLTSPSHGTLTLNANGSFTYTPVYSYTGTDSFTYRDSDGTANSNTATVNITITASSGNTATFGLDTGTYTWYQGSGVLDAQRFANTAGTGTLTKLELLFTNDNSPSGNVRMGVYADNNGVPGNLLLDAGEVPAGTGWVSITGLNLPVTQGTYYWLAYNLSSANNVVDADGPDSSDIWVNYTYGTFPAQFPLNSYGVCRYPYVMRGTVSK